MAGCEPVEELREDALLDFLVRNGGRVQNKELVQRYKGFINAPDPQQKSKYRDIFKDIINKIAVVKQEDGEKYIILKKKYQHLLQGSSSNSTEEKVILNTPVQASFEQTSEKVQPANFGEVKQPSSLSDIQCSEIRELSSTVFTTPAKVNACEWIAEDLQAFHTISKAPLEGTNDCQGNPRLCYSQASEEKQDEKLYAASESNAESPVNIEIKVEEAQEEEFDSVLKDDLEQNGLEDGSGSMGSPSVALDPLEKEWLKCAAIGHLTALCDLLRQDPSLAMKKDFTSTALHWAAKHGKENMARMLINAGVDINLRASALLIGGFCMRGFNHPRIRKPGSSLSSPHCLSLFSIQLRSLYCSVPSIVLLLAVVVVLIIIYTKGYTPLHIAALHSHLDIVDLLINNYGAKTNVRDYSGRFASHYLKDNDDSTDSSNVSSNFQQSRGERRNRKLAGLFLPKSCGSSKKNWSSVENLTTDDKDCSIFLSVPTSYKAVRKFSR